MICVMIHSGSRGLGYQVCDDACHAAQVPEKYGIAFQTGSWPALRSTVPRARSTLPPCAPPPTSPGAIPAAHDPGTRGLRRDLRRSWQEMRMNLVYDVCHNIAKFEEPHHRPKEKARVVHRKGATRAFPPEHPRFRHCIADSASRDHSGRHGPGQLVLVGQQGSMDRTFGTTCHGAGRAMSRTAAVKDAAGRRIDKEAGSQRHHRPRSEPQRIGRGAAQGVQERRRRLSRSWTGAAVAQGGADAANRGDQG